MINFGIIKNFVIVNFPQIARILNNQMSIYFVDIVQSHNTFYFYVQKFDVKREHDITQGFDWFIRPFYAKRSWILPLDETIHISSFLDELITSPDKFLKTSRRLRTRGPRLGEGGTSYDGL